MAKQKKDKIKFCLVVTYKDCMMDLAKDKLIVKLVGRPELGSGFCLMSGERDLDFGFATLRGAEGAKRRLQGVWCIKCKIYEDE